MQGNNIDRLVNKLARDAYKREGLAMELNGARAKLADLQSKTV